MHVGGAALDRLGDDLVDELDRGGVVGAGAQIDHFSALALLLGLACLGLGDDVLETVKPGDQRSDVLRWRDRHAHLIVVAATGGGEVTPTAVLGVLSLILWALIVVVTLKYVLILLRADNNGEGGTLTLMALAQRALGRSTPILVLLGTISGALFYGDAVITPALSVLSAVEGLKLATPARTSRRFEARAWLNAPA